MAQYFTDFSDQTVGEFPSGWTGRITQTADWEVVDRAAPHGKSVRSTTSTSTRKALTYDDAGTSTDVEVYIEYGVVTGQPAGDCRIAGRADITKNTSAGTAHIYALGVRHPDNQVGKYVDGSFTLIGEVASPFGFLNDDESRVFCARARINGTSLKTKSWLKAGGEPAGWDIENTDTSITGAGAAGIFAFANSVNRWWSAVGIGTDGDAAPTEPVTGGSTAIPPSSQNLGRQFATISAHRLGGVLQ